MSAATHPPARFARAGFTVIELLIVVAIIAILVAAIVAASTVFVQKARTNNTRSVLLIVEEALEQFQRDQTANPTVTRIKQGALPIEASFRTRYGLYPPDELEVFTPFGLPGAPAMNRFSLVQPTADCPGRSAVPPAAPGNVYGPMRFSVNPANPADAAFEHRDLAAMILAIDLYCEPAKAILDRLPERNRSPGALGPNGDPIQFFDCDGDEIWDSGLDEQIRYILDDWGMPLSYMAQRDWIPNPPAGNPDTKSSNHTGWNEASTNIVRLNEGKPLIFSYGADGKEQLSVPWMKNAGEASLVGDWTIATENAPEIGKIDHHLNADNVYSDPALNEKLARGN